MRSEAEQFEKIPTSVYETPAEACRVLAVEVASLIRQREAAGEQAVLGLATGSTPVPFYRELIRLHREEGLSFKRVITFNLDEYYGLGQNHRESYHRFMREQLFQHIDISAKNTHLPPGTVAREEVYDACRAYEERIQSFGGIDLQILGIGRTGHIGFNEPGSSADSQTRLITLDRVTREDAARDFLGIENVPLHAITMGVGTILKAKRIALMAWGENKADILATAVEGEPTEAVSASFLQRHPKAKFYVDRAAASSLTRYRKPWLVGQLKWDSRAARQAVAWLAQSLGKSVLKLLDEDYNEHGMGELLTEQGPAYQLNIRIFNQLQHTITGWPGGKPGEDDKYRPERSNPHSKRALVLSPEPQDETWAMGGTIHRLVEQGHTVEVAFMTSGNLGVSDREVIAFVGMLRELATTQGGGGWKESVRFADSMTKELAKKGPFGADSEQLRGLKSLVRRGEARHALEACGVNPSRLHFLDLPFYETGRYRQFSPNEKDRDMLASYLAKHRPNQIYLTGRASDPSSVSGVCYRVFQEAWQKLGKQAWKKECRVWHYRGRDKAVEPHEIAMAVPMSPAQLKAKLVALNCYTIADDPGLACRQNQRTAEQYDALGLADYEAIEAFERWG